MSIWSFFWVQYTPGALEGERGVIPPLASEWRNDFFEIFESALRGPKRERVPS